MKKIPVDKAVGLRFGHDITRIVPGKFKGPAFRKGDIIKPEDIDKLRRIGKDYIYVHQSQPGVVHENEASLRISEAIAGEHIQFGQPVEGKVTLKSTVRGLFLVKSRLLFKLNQMKDITIPSLPNHFKVEKNQNLAGVRIVPLVIKEKKLARLESICQKEGTVFSVQTYQPLKVGIITTGNEIYQGLVKDGFVPLLQEKLAYFGNGVQDQIVCPDHIETIKDAINHFCWQGMDLIALTGGMSVDPDDITPKAIRKSGARVVIHGIPVQPGNMFMLAYSGRSTIVGIPAASLFYENTILDIVLPRIFVGEILAKRDFIKMGEGGFCSTCATCHYPYCYFGRSLNS